MKKLFQHLNEGKAARDLEMSKEEFDLCDDLHLLTLKPVVYCCNSDAKAMDIGENYLSLAFKQYIAENESK